MHFEVYANICLLVIIMQKRKTFGYVDFDQTTGEDDVIQSAASLTWPGTASSIQEAFDASVKRCTRESVTYEDEVASVKQYTGESVTSEDHDTAAPLIIRGQFYNNQFHGNNAHPGNWVHTAVSRYGGLLVLKYRSFCFCYILIAHRTVAAFM